MNKKYDLIGKVFDSKCYGKFKVLAETIIIPENANPESAKRYTIQFLDTGYITTALGPSIREGTVRDYMKPTVYEVGVQGSNISILDPEYYHLYKVWCGIISRCYNKNNKDYEKYYGGIGIKVDERWHNFSKFYFDAIFLPNYEKMEKYPTLYELDKDYLQLNIDKCNRIYSKDTCIWISTFDNTMIRNKEFTSFSHGFYGVSYKSHYKAWETVINGVTYGRFTCPEPAANLFNYIFPSVRTPFNDIKFFNIVDNIPYDELQKYCVGSTTIRRIGVESKRVRSDKVSFDYLFEN